MNETLVTLVGRVATEPVARRIADGTKVVNFRLASTERRFSPAEDKWTDGDSIFVAVSCWRKLAQGVDGVLAKGDPVVVTGKLSTRDYEWEGQRRLAVELVARALGPDVSRCAVTVHRYDRDADAERAASGFAAEQERAGVLSVPHQEVAA
ncbi:MAG: single-stranded DNA-binding protein [Sciscionella sp.]